MIGSEGRRQVRAALNKPTYLQGPGHEEDTKSTKNKLDTALLIDSLYQYHP